MARRLAPLLVALGVLVPVAGAQAGWSSGPDMLEPHPGGSATLLHDGSVLMAGGRAEDGSFLATAERLDPHTGTWSPTGSLIASRTATTLLTLNDGSALAIGGFHWNPTGSERYDPVSGTWSSAGPGVEAWNVPAVLLDDGRVLAAGGSGWEAPTGFTMIFDPTVGAWSRVTAFPLPLEGRSATLLADGRVLFAGGREWVADYFWWYSLEAQIYDPATDTWADAAPMPEPRVGHLSERLPDGRVFVVGGANEDVGPLTSARIYDPVANRWSATAPMPFDMRIQESVLLQDGTVMVMGDHIPATGVASSVRYDPASDTWSDAGSLEDRGWGFTATLLADGRVLVAGGWAPAEGYLRSTEIWTPPCTPHPSRGGGKAIGRHAHERECKGGKADLQAARSVG